MTRDFFKYVGGSGLGEIELSLSLMPQRSGDRKKILAGVDMAYLLEAALHFAAIVDNRRVPGVPEWDFDTRFNYGDRDFAFELLKMFARESVENAGKGVAIFTRAPGSSSWVDFFQARYPSHESKLFKIWHYADDGLGNHEDIDPPGTMPSVKDVLPEIFTGGISDTLTYTDEMRASYIESAMSLADKLNMYVDPFCRAAAADEITRDAIVSVSGDTTYFNIHNRLGLDATKKRFWDTSILRSSIADGVRDSVTGEWLHAQGSAERVGNQAATAATAVFSVKNGEAGCTRYVGESGGSDSVAYLPITRTFKRATRGVKVKDEDRVISQTRYFEVVNFGVMPISNSGRLMYTGGQMGTVVDEDTGFNEFDPASPGELPDWGEYVTEKTVELRTTLIGGIALHDVKHGTRSRFY